MRVAHLTTVDTTLRFLLLPQLKAVVDAGGEAVGISAPGPWVAALEREGIRHVALPASTRGMNLLADARAAAQLWRVLRRERPDVLHTHNPKPGVYGRVLGRLAGVPVVVNTLHGLYATETDPLAKRLVVYGLEALASRFSDAELVQNAEDLDLMLRRRIVRSRKARLLGNGVDLARFDPDRLSEHEVRAARAALGAREDQVVVGTVGRLVVEKGYRDLIEAMARLGDGYVLVAAGPEDPQKADALGREELASATAAGVRLLGMREDVEVLYGAMDVFVLASHREGFPRSAMEAAAMRLPIVATDIRGCRQVVEHGVTGLLVPPRDPESLAQAVTQLGDSPALRAQMGAAGRVRARERFDERAVVRIVMEVYQEALASRRR